MLLSATRFLDLKESIFSQMTSKAVEKGALNLAQGFPDFPGPRYLIERIHFYLDNCPNQYIRSSGHLTLCEVLKRYYEPHLSRTYDALNEITVVNGATEGIFATILGLVNPGEKILVFEPYYESYLGAAKAAGASLVGVPLLPPRDDEESEQGLWDIDWESFELGIKDAKLIMLNHPHNPTGKVFAHLELERIFKEASLRAIPVVIDGVYENLIYSPSKLSLKSLFEKYSETTIFISGISKTLSFTGFKVGWVLAPKKLMPGIRVAHESAVFCQPAHLQLAVADVLRDEKFINSYIKEFTQDFLHKRDGVRKTLKDFGFKVPNAQGTYFLMAQKQNAPLKASSDYEMAMELLENCGVATIPVSGFFTKEPFLTDWLRFAFCKEQNTLNSLKKMLASGSV